MRKLARIQFRGNAKDFINAWNRASPLTIEHRVVALYTDDPIYQQLKELFTVFSKDHDLSWHERVVVEYTPTELASFEIFTLHIIGRAGEGGNEFKPVYMTQKSCDECGRVEYIQTCNLALNFLEEEPDAYEDGYFQHDFCETDFHELIISAKLKLLLEQNQISGVSFRPIDHVVANDEILKPYYQLMIENQIGPLIEPSPIERLDLCKVCGQYQQVLLTELPGTLGSEFYFTRKCYSGGWIMKTTDRFGRLPSFSSRFIINQEFYQLLRNNNVTGYWVQPAHLID